MAKPRQLKPWPELTGILPLLKADEPRLKQSEVGHLDLENVTAVDALGLTIYLAKLSQFITRQTGDFYFSMPMDEDVRHQLTSLNFLSHLRAIANIQPYRDIFSVVETFEPVYKDDSNVQKSIQEEIIRISLSSCDRESEIARVKYEMKNFFKRDKDKRFAHEQAMVILLELVKNTLDHSGTDAFLGLRLDSKKFHFNYADTGVGISNSVRQHLTHSAEKLQSSGQPNESALALRLATKGSFADIIQWAFKGGNSTKIGNGVNFGFGLMLIVEAARNCGMRLALRDADTYLLFTELNRKENPKSSGHLSHSYIRQRCVTTSAPPLLLFQGELELEHYAD
jgi:hypothetical protein